MSEDRGFCFVFFGGAAKALVCLVGVFDCVFLHISLGIEIPRTRARQDSGDMMGRERGRRVERIARFLCALQRRSFLKYCLMSMFSYSCVGRGRYETRLLELCLRFHAYFLILNEVPVAVYCVLSTAGHIGGALFLVFVPAGCFVPGIYNLGRHSRHRKYSNSVFFPRCAVFVRCRALCGKRVLLVCYCFPSPLSHHEHHQYVEQYYSLI